MQEFKREKVTLESKVKEMTKAATFHQDHLRIIDAWFKQVRCQICVPDDIEADINCYQLIDEVKILFGDDDAHGKGMKFFQESHFKQEILIFDRPSSFSNFPAVR